MKSITFYPHLLLLASLVLYLSVSQTNAFVPNRQLLSLAVQQNNAQGTRVGASVEEVAAEEDAVSVPTKVLEVFPDAVFLIFEMPEHRPLGCTVEESLDPSDDYVFVSKIVEGGFADQAGIQVGDVVVAVTGMFGDMTIVLESGVDKM